MECVTCCNANISYCIWTEKQKVPLFHINSPLQFSLFRLHCARRNCHWMTPWIHYNAVLIGRQQKAEIKVHSYGGCTTLRADDSDWNQIFKDLNRTEVRHTVEATEQGKDIAVYWASIFPRLYKAEKKGQRCLSTHVLGFLSKAYCGVLVTYQWRYTHSEALWSIPSLQHRSASQSNKYKYIQAKAVVFSIAMYCIIR